MPQNIVIDIIRVLRYGAKWHSREFTDPLIARKILSRFIDHLTEILKIPNERNAYKHSNEGLYDSLEKILRHYSDILCDRVFSSELVPVHRMPLLMLRFGLLSIGEIKKLIEPHLEELRKPDLPEVKAGTITDTAVASLEETLRKLKSEEAGEPDDSKSLNDDASVPSFASTLFPMSTESTLPRSVVSSSALTALPASPEPALPRPSKASPSGAVVVVTDYFRPKDSPAAYRKIFVELFMHFTGAVNDKRDYMYSVLSDHFERIDLERADMVRFVDGVKSIYETEHCNFVFLLINFYRELSAMPAKIAYDQWLAFADQYQKKYALPGKSP